MPQGIYPCLKASTVVIVRETPLIGITVIVVTPMFSNCADMLWLYPSVAPTRATIEAGPKIIPKMVKAVLSFLSRRALKEKRNTSLRSSEEAEGRLRKLHISLTRSSRLGGENLGLAWGEGEI
jgi:hypothetical protein